jgi:hypothetical protein
MPKGGRDAIRWRRDAIGTIVFPKRMQAGHWDPGTGREHMAWSGKACHSTEGLGKQAMGIWVSTAIGGEGIQYTGGSTKAFYRRVRERRPHLLSKGYAWAMTRHGEGAR